MPELICHCFGFTREEMAAEVVETGSSSIPEVIAERCRRGLHACEVKNPSGHCCLGDVRKALKEMTSTRDAAGQLDCCASDMRGDGDEQS